MGLRKTAPVLIMSVASLVGCASQQKKDTPVVKDVHVSGNDQISSRQIKQKILTTGTGWWPFARKQLFDPVAWQADLERIRRFYVAKGFYQADVVRSEIQPRPPDGVALEVEVREGQPTHVGKLDIQGLEALPAADRDAAVSKLPLSVGA